MVQILKNHRLPVQIEGFPYIFGALLLTLSSAMVWKAAVDNSTQASGLARWGALGAMILFGLFTAFCIWFYRNPARHTPQDDGNAVISPADGRVLAVQEVSGSRIGDARARKISIFMSPMDVHVNRAPVTGVVEAIHYHKGKFFKADLDKASAENENNWLVMRTSRGVKVAFGQIAGFVARRIVCYVPQGAALESGERYGMIRFGSRMEVVVPVDSEVLVKPGERTVAGETKLARLAKLGG